MPLLLASFANADPAVIYFAGSVVLVLLTFGGGFASLRTLRSNLAKEFKAEMEAQAKAQHVSVQSPLVVKPEERHVSEVAFDALKADVERLRGEVREGFDKLGQERRVSVANLHTKVDDANRKVDSLSGEMRQLNQQVGQILSRLLNSSKP